MRFFYLPIFAENLPDEMHIFDLAISYKWKYDKEFIELIERIFQRDGLSTFVIGRFNLSEVVENLRRKEIYFRTYLDRASDEDPDFLAISKLLTRKKSYIINPHHKIIKSVDKVLMHKKLVRRKFRLPKTLLLPSFDNDNNLRISDDQLSELGIPFVIKPSLLSGGGEGVIKSAHSLSQIHEERKKNHTEKYLIQEKIYARKIQNKLAWFRIIWAFDKVIPTWWDDQTHIYQRVTKAEVKRHNLLPLYRITQRLARLTQLDYFSTEIALTKDHKFVLIDYVNDQCDMRLKSNHVDGIPDEVVTEFIESMKQKVLSL